MSEEEQLRLQSYLDGELPEGERAQVETWLNAEAEARQLLDELSQTTQVLRANEPEYRLDYTRAFYWNGIAGAIEASEGIDRPGNTEGWLGWLSRYLAPLATSAAVVALLAVFRFSDVATDEPSVESAWEVLDPDTAMVNYSDFESGITVVMLYDQSTAGFTTGD